MSSPALSIIDKEYGLIHKVVELDKSGVGFTCLCSYTQRAELAANRLGERPTARVKAVLKALPDL